MLETYMILDKEKDAEWLPVSVLEMAERGWTTEDLDRRMVEGKLKGYPGKGENVYFETFLERWRWLRFRKLPVSYYEKEERRLAASAGVRYGADVAKENARKKREAEDRRVQKGRCREEEGTSGWNWLCILIQLLCLPFVILLARDVTQWWYGTGKFASKD